MRTKDEQGRVESLICNSNIIIENLKNKRKFIIMKTKEELKSEAIFQALGEVSMCWNPEPSNQVFESLKAEEIGKRLIEKLNQIDQSQEPKQEERYTHCGGNCKNSSGETSVMCCNYCGLPTEKSLSIGKNIYFNPIEPKQREVSEAVEFVDWINNNEINGQYYRHQRLNIWNGDWNPDERHYSPLTTQQLYDLFKSKNK